MDENVGAIPCGRPDEGRHEALPLLAPVWAIVLNWNRAADTRRCVESLQASDYAAVRVLVVDNGSAPDQSAELRHTLSDDVQLIRSPTNLGFGAGNNLGIQSALEQGAAYVLLCNNDTIVDTSMIGLVVRAMDADPSIGIAGPIVYYLNEPTCVWLAGYRFHGRFYAVPSGLHLKPPLRPVEPVDFVSGCGMFIQREMVQQIGMFSPDFFMYCEDLDLCLRAQRAGWKIACVTDAKMWHQVSASLGGALSLRKQYHQIRSSWIVYRRHTRGIMLIANMGFRLIHSLYILVRRLWHRMVNIR